MLLVSDDLGVVARAAHRVAVMYAGEVVEAGTTADVFGRPRHPYTRGLMASIPVPGQTKPGARLGAIAGTVPSLIGELKGCGFRERCSHAATPCAERVQLRSSAGHDWRCVLEEAGAA